MTQPIEALQELISSCRRDDSLQYRVQANRLIRKEGVRISVKVTALVTTRDYNQQALEQRILQALNRFIAAKWIFFGMKREADAAGYERVTLTAAATVGTSENWNLQERAREAGGDGLSMSDVAVSYASSIAEIDGVVNQLRVDILEQVNIHLDHYRKMTGRQWRIGAIVFGVGDEDRSYTGKGARRLDSGTDNSIEHDEMMDGSERITLRASVELRATGI